MTQQFYLADFQTVATLPYDLHLHAPLSAGRGCRRSCGPSSPLTCYPLGALAHLELARAYAVQKDTVRAHAAYQNFLTLWRDADLDIPVLKEAKAEYAELQQAVWSTFLAMEGEGSVEPVPGDSHDNYRPFTIAAVILHEVYPSDRLGHEFLGHCSCWGKTLLHLLTTLA